MRWPFRSREIDERALDQIVEKSAESYAAEIARIENRVTQIIGDVKPADEYARNPWLFRAIKVVAESVASLPRTIVDASGNQIPLPEIIDLLANPSRTQDGYEHFVAVSSWLQLEGRALVYKGTADGAAPDTPDEGRARVAELVVLNPTEWTPRLSSQGVLEMWERGSTKIHPTRMIPMCEWSPKSAYDGVGAGDAAAIALHLDYWAQAWNAEGFRKGGSHKRLVYETDATMQPGQVKQWRRRLEALYGGMKGGWRGIIAHSGMKVRELGGSQRDQEFGEMRTRTREDVLAATGAQPGIVGVLELANYSNMEVQEKLFWTMTVLPHMRRIESAYTRHLVAVKRPGARFAFDVSQVEALQPDITAVLDNAAKMRGLMTYNEIRTYLQASGVKQIEKPEVDGGDAVLVPFSDVPLATVASDDAASDTTSTITESAEAFFSKAPYAVPSAVSKQVNERLRGAMARRFAGEIKGVLGRTERHLIRQLGAGSVNAALEAARDRTHEDALDTLLDTHKRELSARANQQLEALRSRERLTGEDLRSGDVAEYIEQRSQNFADSWSNTVVDRIERSLRKGEDDGEDVPALRGRVRSVVTAERTRARWVAHTEATSTFNAANDFAYAMSGVVKAKEWLSAQDGAVRDTHAAADGQVVALDETFSVGGARLRWPGDPAAPVEETINCRCTTVPAEIGG